MLFLLSVIGVEELQIEEKEFSQTSGEKNLSENEILAQAIIFFLADYGISHKFCLRYT